VVTLAVNLNKKSIHTKGTAFRQEAVSPRTPGLGHPAKQPSPKRTLDYSLCDMRTPPPWWLPCARVAAEMPGGMSQIVRGVTTQPHFVSPLALGVGTGGRVRRVPPPPRASCGERERERELFRRLDLRQTVFWMERSAGAKALPIRFPLLLYPANMIHSFPIQIPDNEEHCGLWRCEGVC